MNRKKFIKTASLAAFSISVFGFVSSKDNKFIGDCETTNDILGPFYRPDAPTRYDLTKTGLRGSVIELKGTVYKSDCTSPLRNALVEIWHCNADGDYDNESSDFQQRAKCMTNEQGTYGFKTILPGKYLNGGLYRPAHIHFRISEANSKELISQIYFEGDPHIEKDPWASKKEAELRILPITLADTKGNLTVTFDAYLGDR